MYFEILGCVALVLDNVSGFLFGGLHAATGQLHGLVLQCPPSLACISTGCLQRGINRLATAFFLLCRSYGQAIGHTSTYGTEDPIGMEEGWCGPVWR